MHLKRAFLVIIVAINAQANVAHCQEGSPNTTEIMHWIKEIVQDYERFPDGELIPGRKSQFANFFFTYSDCVIEYSFSFIEDNNEVVRFQSVHLGDLDVCEISTNPSSILLKTLSDKEVVKNWWVGDSFPFHSREEDAIRFPSLVIFVTESNANRLKIGFDHVISACGGEGN